tara:strand:+ start:1314 stop:1448 length:135 start_codon:yes stop_codon:yes gene_type:complete
MREKRCPKAEYVAWKNKTGKKATKETKRQELNAVWLRRKICNGK